MSTLSNFVDNVEIAFCLAFLLTFSGCQNRDMWKVNWHHKAELILQAMNRGRSKGYHWKGVSMPLKTLALVLLISGSFHTAKNLDGEKKPWINSQKENAKTDLKNGKSSPNCPKRPFSRRIIWLWKSDHRFLRWRPRWTAFVVVHSAVKGRRSFGNRPNDRGVRHYRGSNPRPSLI